MSLHERVIARVAMIARSSFENCLVCATSDGATLQRWEQLAHAQGEFVKFVKIAKVPFCVVLNADGYYEPACVIGLSYRLNDRPAEQQEQRKRRRRRQQEHVVLFANKCTSMKELN